MSQKVYHLLHTHTSAYRKNKCSKIPIPMCVEVKFTRQIFLVNQFFPFLTYSLKWQFFWRQKHVCMWEQWTRVDPLSGPHISTDNDESERLMNSYVYMIDYMVYVCVPEGTWMFSRLAICVCDIFFLLNLHSLCVYLPVLSRCVCVCVYVWVGRTVDRSVSPYCSTFII